MITLITGGPGTGKTAWLLDQLLELRKREPDREIFIHGVRNLRFFAHEQIFCKSQLCDICRAQNPPDTAKFVEDWPKWKTSGSLIVVDEVQRIWRPGSAGSTVSDAISGLETHRHYGLDFWLISQGPHLFHNFIRLLIGRHVHLVSHWSGRKQYEWPECRQNITSRSDAVVRTYTLPKRVYKMYDSAEVHTKQDKRRPLSFYALIIIVVLTLSLSAYAFYRLKSRSSTPTPPTASALSAAAAGGDASAATHAAAATMPDFTPTVPGVLESAPAYMPLLKVTEAPILVACILSKAKDLCTCYTSQATVYPTSKAYCMEQVAGHRFNPYLVHSEKKPEKESESKTMPESENLEKK